MSPSLFNELKNAAQQQQDAAPQRTVRMAKALFFAILAIALLVIAGGIFMALYMNFKWEKAFSLQVIAKAAPQQVDFVQGALIAPNALDPDHCFVSPAEYYMREGREAWFFGARLRGDAARTQGGAAASTDWFLCLLFGPKNAPEEIRAFGEQASSLHAGEPMYSVGTHPGFRASMRYGSENVSRFLDGEFDYPDRRPKGLFWKMAGLGPEADWP